MSVSYTHLKTNENCNDKCKNAIPDKELTNNNNNVEHNECNIENNNVFKELVSESEMCIRDSFKGFILLCFCVLRENITDVKCIFR